MKHRGQFVAVSQIWTKAYYNCMETYGTDLFITKVWGFYHSLLDLGQDDELKIKSKVTNYIKEIWDPAFNEAVAESVKEETSDTQNVLEWHMSKVMRIHIKALYEYIIQTIQDSGIGWEFSKGGGGYDIGTKFTE